MKKKIFNFIRLFLALAILNAVLMLWIGYFKSTHKSDNEFYGTIFASSLFFIIGILLLWSYFRKRTKREATADAYHSSFYKRFQGIVQFFDGLSFQGFGTKYMMFTDQAPDDYVAATNWLILGTFPIVPLYRNRIKAGKEQHTFRLFYSVTSTRIDVLDRELLSRKQNRMVYLFHYLFFIPMIIAPIVLYLANLNYVNTMFPGKRFWYLILIWFAWGILMVYISELFHKRWFARKMWK